MASFNRSEVRSISNHESSFSPHPPGLMVLSPSDGPNARYELPCVERPLREGREATEEKSALVSGGDVLEACRNTQQVFSCSCF